MLGSACADASKQNNFGTRMVPERITGATTLENPQGEALSEALGYWGGKFREDPADSHSALNYAINLQVAGDNEKAFSVLQRASQHSPSDAMLGSEYGRLALKLGKTELADGILAQVEKQSDTDWRVLSARGTIFAKRGEPEMALGYFKRALALAPNEPSVINNLALAYALNGNAHEAESLLRKIADKGQDNGRIKQNLALVVGLQGRFGEAQEINETELSTSVATSNLTYLRNMIPAPAKPKVVADSAVRAVMADGAGPDKAVVAETDGAKAVEALALKDLALPAPEPVLRETLPAVKKVSAPVPSSRQPMQPVSPVQYGQHVQTGEPAQQMQFLNEGWATRVAGEPLSILPPNKINDVQP